MQRTYEPLPHPTEDRSSGFIEYGSPLIFPCPCIHPTLHNERLVSDFSVTYCSIFGDPIFRDFADGDDWSGRTRRILVLGDSLVLPPLPFPLLLPPPFSSYPSPFLIPTPHLSNPLPLSPSPPPWPPPPQVLGVGCDQAPMLAEALTNSISRHTRSSLAWRAYGLDGGDCRSIHAQILDRVLPDEGDGSEEAAHRSAAALFRGDYRALRCV